MTLQKSIFLRIGRREYPVADFAQASEMFCRARDESGFGASKVPQVFIVDDAGECVAKISYNGRVWPPEEWQPGQQPLFDNRT